MKEPAKGKASSSSDKGYSQAMKQPPSQPQHIVASDPASNTASVSAQRQQGAAPRTKQHTIKSALVEKLSHKAQKATQHERSYSLNQTVSKHKKVSSTTIVMGSNNSNQNKPNHWLAIPLGELMQ